MYTTRSELVGFMYWTTSSMNNVLSYFGLVDARISASEKDLPVLNIRDLQYYVRDSKQNVSKTELKWVENAMNDSSYSY